MAKRVPVDPAEQAEYDDFAKRWEAIWKEGHRRGWLSWSGGYDEGKYELYEPERRQNAAYEREQSREWREKEEAKEQRKREKEARQAAQLEAARKRIYGG